MKPNSNFVRLRYALSILLILVCLNSLEARDVNLDKIYIKKSSEYLSRIINHKLDFYKVIGASFIEKNVIFAKWTSGNRLIYIKEYLKQNKNYIYEYYPASRVRKRLFYLPGAIVFSRISSNGKYLVLKRLISRNSTLPESEIVIYDLRSKKRYILKSKNYFLDFTLSFYGDSIFYETKEGIVEYFPAQNRRRVAFYRGEYNHLRVRGNPVLLYVSPNKKNKLLVSGGGGEYASLLYVGDKPSKIQGITSASELFWLNNKQLVFRKGYTGYYQVVLYDINKQKDRVISKYSFNTNISFSSYNKIITYVEDGAIVSRKLNARNLKKYPLEGEDINYSPKGNKFTVIYNKTLFIAEQNILNKKFIALKRITRKILNSYKKLSRRSSEWENRYSKDYIMRKIKLYNSFLK